MFMRIIKLSTLATMFLFTTYSLAGASYITVDVLGLTTNARIDGDITVPDFRIPPSLGLMPFYLRVSYPSDLNNHWGLEFYTDNRHVFGTQTTGDGIYRGLRARGDIEDEIPLYWQVYDFDQNVAGTWGTPNSVTTVVDGTGLGFYTNTLRFWSPVYDLSDIDHNPTQDRQEPDRRWETERPLRTFVSIEALGDFPQPNRPQPSPPVYFYLAGDMRASSSQEYIGHIKIDFFDHPFNFSGGCFATPNPFKPVLGQRTYFNFYTNSPDSQITIKIFDPTGFPVVTLRNTRYWDGRNSNYQYVEGGLYLYQIETEGHVIGGTVVVIK